MNRQKSSVIYSEILDLLKKKEPCILSTVTATRGSTPQKPGSSIIFGADELLAGTIGGGPTELAVEKIAKQVINSKKSVYYPFDLNHDISETEAAICGGGMNILIDAEPEKSVSEFEALTKSLSNRIPGVLITICTCKAPEVSSLKRHWLTKENLNKFSIQIEKTLIDTAKNMLSHVDKNDFIEIKYLERITDKIAFLELITPKPQLVIAGAGHIGKALAHYAKLLDFEVIVWDDREEFANKENLPDADVIWNGSIENSLAKFTAKEDTYIVIVTRGHKNDSDVLKHFISSKAGYIGMIGSKKKIAQVRETFLDQGWATKEQWDKIYSPIGLKIGSKTVQEIAISIAAQLVQTRDEKRKL